MSSIGYTYYRPAGATRIVVSWLQILSPHWGYSENQSFKFNNMKNTSILLAFICLLMLSACEEVIQLELDTANQRVVTEANFNATEGRCTVSLSKSGGFYELSNFEALEDASVVLIRSSGQDITLTDLGNGQYSAENLTILPGETTGIPCFHALRTRCVFPWTADGHATTQCTRL